MHSDESPCFLHAGGYKPRFFLDFLHADVNFILSASQFIQLDIIPAYQHRHGVKHLDELLRGILCALFILRGIHNRLGFSQFFNLLGVLALDACLIGALLLGISFP